MQHVILGDRYLLQECLRETKWTRLFKATDGNGTRYMVKFIADPDLFFEEMARYYACDNAEAPCKLIYNYPAYLISQDPMFFEPDILRLYGLDEHQVQPEAGSFMENVGALVFEYIDGRPLLECLYGKKPEEQLALMARAAGSIAELHREGESHGNLTPAKILLEHHEGKVRLVGLGSGEQKEEEEADLNLQLADDVQQFATHFLKAIHSDDPLLKRLIDQCCHEKPERRPLMSELSMQLARMSHGRNRRRVPRFAWAAALPLFL